MNIEHVLDVARETMRAADYCFLMTLGNSDRINARLMQHFPPGDDLIVWFGTSPHSRKVIDLDPHHYVTLAFQAPQEPAYATLSGPASLEDRLEMRQRYWRDDWFPFFPGGPSSDGYVLLRVEPRRIEVMNFARDIAPAPFGLKPATLEYGDAGWYAVEDTQA
jgi:general stress protein 26